MVDKERYHAMHNCTLSVTPWRELAWAVSARNGHIYIRFLSLFPSHSYGLC